MEDRRPYGAGLALVAAGVALLSLKGIVIKLSYALDIDAVSLLLLRLGIALPVYLVVARFAGAGGEPLSRRQWLGVAGCGLLGAYLASILDFWALQYITASLERLVLYAYPTLVLLFSRILFGRRIRRSDLAALALAYSGLALVFVQDARLYDLEATAVGTALVLASAAAYALFLVGSGELIPKLGSVRFTAYAMIAAAAGIGVHFALARPTAIATLPAEGFALAGFLAVACTLAPSFLMSAGLGRVGAANAAMVGMIGPPVTIAAAHFVLGEAVTWRHGVGTVLIIAGVLGVTLRGRRRAAETAAAPRERAAEPE
ncbi:DMT family transporter [Ectothiorhodospiraceae bacterium WFHF3C12]|nr:DMT family transporter [Ectothiorhodospiraceae bacterium WFHF3C12]